MWSVKDSKTVYEQWSKKALFVNTDAIVSTIHCASLLKSYVVAHKLQDSTRYVMLLSLSVEWNFIQYFSLSLYLCVYTYVLVGWAGHMLSISLALAYSW